MPDKMDDLDYNLIFELQQDTRRSSARLAERLGTSEATVRRRVRRLLNDGVIKITAVPEPSKVGFVTSAVVAIEIDLSRLNSVAEQLVAHENVHYVSLTTGRFDILIWVLCRSPEELKDFLTVFLPGIPGVNHTETFINLELKKCTLGWLLPAPPPYQALLKARTQGGRARPSRKRAPLRT